MRVLAEAVQFRVFASVPSVPAPGIYFHAAKLAREALLEDWLVERNCMPVWEWIKSMPSRRRKALVRAYYSYLESGDCSSNIDIFTPFVKTEMLPFFKQHAPGVCGPCGLEYVPRLIQAPHDETHLIAGPWLKPLVPALKDSWSYEHWLFYASVNPTKLDAWLNRCAQAESWFWSDYSMFDATYSAEAWEMLESFYALIYPHAPLKFWKVMDIWRSPHGRAKCRATGQKMEYFAPPMNASGRDDTALANALINGIVLSLSIAAALKGCSVFELSSADVRSLSSVVNIAVVGDDSLVACSFDVAPIAGAIERNIQSFGLVVKAAHSKRLVDVTFLGQMPYRVGDQYFWGPTLGRRLYKCFWQCKPVGNLPAWTLGVAKQLALYRHVPLLYDIAARIIQLLPGGKVTDYVIDPNRVWAARTEETPCYGPETIGWLASRYEEFGLSVRQIEADISAVGEIHRLPAMVRYHTTDIACAVDDL
ncbi:hypothetical protein 2 [Forsythia suspensa yan-like virus]|nr:hypothetical protein 2 [Forsythia suspensa yan-like virus]